MGSNLQFPPPDSIELVENLNLLSDIQQETPLVQSKLQRWQSDLHFLKNRFSVIETSQRTLKRKIKGLIIATVILTFVVTLLSGYYIMLVINL